MLKRQNLLTSPRRGIGTLPVIAVCGGLGVVTAALWAIQHNQIRTLDADRARSAAALTQAKAQIQDLTERINLLTQRQIQTADRTSEAPVRRTAPAKRQGALGKSDPRLDRLQGQLTQTRKDLADTREDLAKAEQALDGKIASTRDELSSTRDDLNGSIARTHDEVAALARRGEQNIYEFRLSKSKQLQRVGPVSLALRSTSAKHKTYDLTMLVDDNTLSKKHVNLYEPVWITLSDRPQPVQLVVNRVGKDEVEGYVSEPKYKKSELATSATAAEPAKVLPTR